MNKEKVFSYIQDYYDIKPEQTFVKHPEVLTFRHNNKKKKWFAVYMPVDNIKLKLDTEGTTDVLCVKSDPILVASLSQKEGYFPAYHMNKAHWLSINLNGKVSFDEITHLIELSYNLTI